MTKQLLSQVHIYKTEQDVLNIIPTGIDANLKNFILYGLEKSKTKNRKVPVNFDGYRTDHTDPQNHFSATELAPCIVKSNGLFGLGLVLHEGNPYFCIDIDGINNDARKNLLKNVLAEFPNAALELSISKKGIHLFGSSNDIPEHRNRNDEIEFYSKDRMIALTGFEKKGDASNVFELKSFLTKFGLLEDKNNPDIDILKKCKKTKTDEGFASFNDLFDADSSVLSAHYPATNRKDGLDFDLSSAEFALFKRIAYHTQDAEQILRIYNLSQLSKLRNPDDKGSGYFETSIQNAIDSNRKDKSDSIRDTHIRPRMSFDEMMQDLAYIQNGYVWNFKTGSICSISEAKQWYIECYEMVETSKGPRRRQLFDRWLKFDGIIAGNNVEWQPNRPRIVPAQHGGMKARDSINTWLGIKQYPLPANHEEKVKPFLDHIEYLVPIKNERDRFLNWLAHIIQKPDELPHTAYIFYTPTKGTGRSWLNQVLASTIYGYVLPSAKFDQIIAGGFNGEMSEKLLAIDNELIIDQNSSWTAAEYFRRLITNEVTKIKNKYGMEVLEKNCCRWLAFTNDMTSLPVDDSDRRFIFIENPTNRKSDEYYKNLYALTHNIEFISSVFHLLKNRDISAFNPGEHAPMNDLKQRIISATRSGLEMVLSEYKDSMISERKYLTTMGDIEHEIMTSGIDKPSNKHRRIVLDTLGFQVFARKPILGQKETLVFLKDYLSHELLKQKSSDELARLLRGEGYAILVSSNDSFQSNTTPIVLQNLVK